MEKQKEKQKFLESLIKPRNAEETEKMYAQWAETYDEDVIDLRYNGAETAVSYFLELDYAKECRILDIGAGTGNVGVLLQNHGYNNIDALDGSAEMLDLAKEKSCYKNIINSIVSSNIRLPIEDNTYDVIIMAGVLCPGHISFDAFDEIIRITKSDGTICWVMAKPENYKNRDEQYSERNIQRFIASLCDQLKWIPILGYPKLVQYYSIENNGWFYAMKVM